MAFGRDDPGARPDQQRECLACHLIDKRDDLDSEDLEESCPVCGFDPEAKISQARDGWPPRERRRALRDLTLDHLHQDHLE